MKYFFFLNKANKHLISMEQMYFKQNILIIKHETIRFTNDIFQTAICQSAVKSEKIYLKNVICLKNISNFDLP